MAKKNNNERYKGVLMTYKELGSTMFHQTLSMLRNAENIDLGGMSRINLVFKAVVKRMDEMQEKYIHEIQKPFYAKLKENGIDWEEGSEPPELDDAQMETFKKLKDENEAAIKEFEKNSVYVDCIPLGPQHLKEIKTLSPARLDSLGGLYDAEGTVRQKALGGKLGVVR